MKEYHLESKLAFGKCKGYTIRQIYQFSPSYLEWLIENTDFYIKKEELYNLPKPTPYKKRYPGIVFNGKSSLSAIKPKDCDVYFALEFLEGGGTIEEKEFVFSSKSFEILEKKRIGAYSLPKKKIPFFDGRSVKELAQEAKPIKIKKKKFDPGDLR